jgi:hypothetical protein
MTRFKGVRFLYSKHKLLTMKQIISLFVSVFILISAFSQAKMEFRDVKIIDSEKKTVYFQIKGLGEDESERNQVLNRLLADSKIYEGRIFTSSFNRTRCQLILDIEIDPEYIRNILLENGYDFEFSSVSIDGKFLEADMPSIKSPFYYPSKNFPKPIYTGDKQKDAETYQVLKVEWIQKNKKEYNSQMKKSTAKLPIIIPKEQFDSFTPEKQAKILSQPDIYVVK